MENKKITYSDIKKIIDTETSKLTSPKDGEKKIAILYPMACATRDLMLQISLNQVKLEIAREKILSDPFIVWLNHQNQFLLAKDKLYTNNVIPTNTPTTTKEFLTLYVLEFSLVTAIGYLRNVKTLLKDSVATKNEVKEIKIAMKALRGKFRIKNRIYFEYENEQFLFQSLLDNLLTRKHNIFSSLKNHRMLIREIITKRIMHSLFFLLKETNLKDEIFTSITAYLVKLFFKPMHRGGALKLFAKIKNNILAQEQWKEMRVHDLLIDLYTLSHIDIDSASPITNLIIDKNIKPDG